MAHTVPDTIAALYDAALDRALWPAALGALIETIGGSGGNLILIEHATGAMPLWQDHGLDAGRDEYIAWAHTIDPAARYALAHPQCRVFYDYLFVDEAAMNRHDYYAWLARNGDWRYCLGARVYSGAGHSGFVSIQRKRALGHVQAGEIARFEQLLPHLERSVQIALKLDTLGAEVAAGDWLLDRAPIGIALIDRHGRVVKLNPRARRMLAARDGLASAHGHMRVLHRQARAEFNRLLGAVLAGAGGNGASAGGTIRVPRPSGLRAYALMVAPLPARGFALAGAAAVVSITDPEDAPELPVAVLMRLFGLTHTEAELAALLATGCALPAAAARLGIARSTARSHLDHILRKTGTHRQSELVALLLHSPAAWSTPEAAP